MATAAGKHLTVFMRKRTAKGAGRKAAKDKFIELAAKTIDIPLRSDRNEVIKKGMTAAGLRTGKYFKRSKGKGPKLAGKYYVVGKGQSVTSALAAAGGRLETILSGPRA